MIKVTVVSASTSQCCRLQLSQVQVDVVDYSDDVVAVDFDAVNYLGCSCLSKYKSMLQISDDVVDVDVDAVNYLGCSCLSKYKSMLLMLMLMLLIIKVVVV